MHLRDIEILGGGGGGNSIYEDAGMLIANFETDRSLRRIKISFLLVSKNNQMK